MPEPSITLAPEAVASAFFAAWATHDIDAVLRFLAPDCRFINGDMGTTIGANALRNLYAGYFDACTGFEFRVTALSAALDGKTVLNERVDILRYGSNTLTIPVAGAIVVENGLISEIRDYFDATAAKRQREAWPVC